MGDILEYRKAPPRWRLRRILLWTGLVGLLAVICWTTWQYRNTLLGGMTGRAEADRQWRAGNPTVYGVGYRDFANNIEPTTGLPIEPIAGCLIDDRIEARASWHNQRVFDLITLHGPPTNSWLKREPGVCYPKSTWNDRIARGETSIPIGYAAASVTCGTAGRAYLIRIPANESFLEIDGIELHTPFLSPDGLEALGGTQDDSVIYIRGTTTPGYISYIAVQAGGHCLRLEMVELP